MDKEKVLNTSNRAGTVVLYSTADFSLEMTNNHLKALEWWIAKEEE